MSRTSIRSTRNLAAAFVVAAAVSPAASSASPDLGSPDAHDALVAAQHTRPDPRSPDARDAGLAAQRVSVADPRSPDARDAGLLAERSAGASSAASDAALNARWGEYQNLVTRNAGRTAAAVPVVDAADPVRRTDWDSEGIIAGGGVAVMLAGLGVVLFTRRHRVVHPRNPAAFG